MPFDPREDEQPRANPTGDTHRAYVPAQWKTRGEGGGRPKISGGYEVDAKGTPIPTRGLNRPDQRYQQAPDTVSTMRQTRAIAENATTVCLRGAHGEIEVRGQSGNCYDVSLVAGTCDCPDFLKLQQSYDFRIIFCKHIRIAMLQVQAAGPAGLFLATQYVAQQLNIDLRTVEDLCAEGAMTAFKANNVWCINPSVIGNEIPAYAERIPFYAGPAE